MVWFCDFGVKGSGPFWFTVYRCYMLQCRAYGLEFRRAETLCMCVCVCVSVCVCVLVLGSRPYRLAARLVLSRGVEATAQRDLRLYFHLLEALEL